MNPNPSKKGRLNFNMNKSPSSLPQPECVSMNQIMNAKRMRSQTKELPEEIVTEIQLRLPVKSLVRFRCVSKHWLSSTNDPKFIRLHINRLRDQHNHLYDCDNSTTISSYPQCSIILSFNCNGPFIPKIPVGSKIQCIGGGYREEAFHEALDFDFPLIQGQYFEIKACCDGLVCLFIGQATLVLWNPSIRQHRILPLPPYVVEDHAELEVFGLGYDSTIDDYKLVRLPTMPGFNLMESNVFNLKSNKWTRIPDLPCYIGIDQDLAISSHGGLYWIASVDSNIKDMILRFDLADETYRKIPLPPNKSTVQCNYRLGLWGGFICLLLDHAFWVMKGGGEQGWIKVMTIPKIPAPQDSVFSYLFEALCLTKSGKVVIVISRVKFFLYDPREQTVMELNIPGLQDGWFQETIYFESLVSPWGGNA